MTTADIAKLAADPSTPTTMRDAILRQLHTPGVEKPAAQVKVKIPRGMNGWEKQYAARLAAQRAAGEIEWYGFEAVRLRLATGAYFKPDFPVVLIGGRLEFHEVKGMWREAARLRIKVAAELYPHWRFVAVSKVDGAWEEEDFSSDGGSEHFYNERSRVGAETPRRLLNTTDPARRPDAFAISATIQNA